MAQTFFLFLINLHQQLRRNVSHFLMDTFFLALAINLTKKCLIFELISFPEMVAAAGTVLGLGVAHNNQKVADSSSTTRYLILLLYTLHMTINKLSFLLLYFPHKNITTMSRSILITFFIRTIMKMKGLFSFKI